jgi:hypothetical protein
MDEGVRLKMADQKPTVAFVLSLLAGVFIIVGGGARAMMGALIGRYRRYSGMMVGHGVFARMMRGLGIGFRLIEFVGVVFGIMVIVSALMLYSRPSGHTAWGALILVFSVLSVFGSIFGFVLGIIGGILAIIWHPNT